MRQLRNRLCKEDAIARVKAEPFSRTSISFYRYVMIEDPETLRNELFRTWSEIGVLGRIYLAHEGINAQLNIPEHAMEAFRASVDAVPEFKDVPFKIGVEERDISFWKLTIKVRKYILADGLADNEYDVTNVGTHLDAKSFNEAIEQGAIVVDMRNAYESAIGHFEGAITPQVETFREELPVVLEELKGKEKEKVLLYCTGGIRCEKASAYLKHHGFKDVNQLHGGIIDYKHQIDREGLPSKFKGANYVFDGRGIETITEDVLGSCHHCKGPTNQPVNCKNDACHLLFLECEACERTHQRTCSARCAEIAALPEEEQKALRRGQKASMKISV